MAGWFNKEINGLADLEGLKMRIPGLGGEVFQRAGGVAVAMPGAEVFTSLQTGVIDATEWVSPFNDLALGLQSVGKYYYYPGWHEPGTTLEALVNREAWEELPADLQAILVTACRAVNADLLDELTTQNAAALKTLLNEHDVELRKLPVDVVERLQELSAEVVAEAGMGDELAQRILASYNAYLAEVREYHRITERAYVEARD